MKDYQVKQLYKSEEELDIFNNGKILSRDVYHVEDIALGFEDEIFLPVFAQNPWYICHEMSHVILYNWKHVKNDYHGPNFCYIYLELIAWVLGRDTRNKLRKLFIKNGVQISNNLV